MIGFQLNISEMCGCSLLCIVEFLQSLIIMIPVDLLSEVSQVSED